MTVDVIKIMGESENKELTVKDKISFVFSILSVRLNNGYIYRHIPNSISDSLFIMEKTGKAMARLYWYHDDNTTVYLDWLNVDENERNKGIGTELQELREKIGIAMGAKESCLWVIKDKWMHDWYKRRGYVDWIDNDKEVNAIWMKKSLA